jgi:hypothetical protein
LPKRKGILQDDPAGNVFFFSFKPRNIQHFICQVHKVTSHSASQLFNAKAALPAPPHISTASRDVLDAYAKTEAAC